MTTITIERKLLEEVVEIFDNAISARYPHEILRDIRAALSAPATAPAWHDAPTVPGLWMGWHNHVHQIEAGDLRKFSLNSGLRWFGPIPEDKP